MNKEKIKQLIFIGAFIFFLIFPNLLNFLGIKFSAEGTENRAPASFPEIDLTSESIKTFPARFENYYIDSFTLRNLLIKQTSVLKTRLFDKSITDRVLIGEEGWLFLNRFSGLDNLSNYKNNYKFVNTFSPILAQRIQERSEWLEERNIKFIFAIAPNKHTVYPEFIPEHIKVTDGPDLADTLVENLELQGINTIYYKDVLIEGKSLYPTYQQTDTHWTHYGAFLAFNKFLDEASKEGIEIQRKDISEFEISLEETNGGDLANMISQADIFKENRLRMVPKFEEAGVILEDTQQEEGSWRIRLKNEREDLPRLLIFGDSYSLYQLLLLKESFSEVLIVRSPLGFDTELIEAFEPDIVLQQMVERGIVEEGFQLIN